MELKKSDFFDLDEKIEQQKKGIFEAELSETVSDGVALRDFCVTYYC